jgi:hypothetical protein
MTNDNKNTATTETTSPLANERKSYETPKLWRLGEIVALVQGNCAAGCDATNFS